MSAYETHGQSDDWITPKYIFDEIGETFDLDVAAPQGGPRYVPCDAWISEGSLGADWHGFVWMNPPFGHQRHKLEWLGKFIDHGNGIALMPDRTSAPWFQQAVKQMDMALFMAPKVKFERVDGSVGGSPGTGTVLMAIGARGAAALVRGRELGCLMVPV